MMQRDTNGDDMYRFLNRYHITGNRHDLRIHYEKNRTDPPVGRSPPMNLTLQHQQEMKINVSTHGLHVPY